VVEKLKLPAGLQPVTVGFGGDEVYASATPPSLT